MLVHEGTYLFHPDTWVLGCTRMGGGMDWDQPGERSTIHRVRGKGGHLTHPHMSNRIEADFLVYDMFKVMFTQQNSSFYTSRQEEVSASKGAQCIATPSLPPSLHPLPHAIPHLHCYYSALCTVQSAECTYLHCAPPV